MFFRDDVLIGFTSRPGSQFGSTTYTVVLSMFLSIVPTQRTITREMFKIY